MTAAMDILQYEFMRNALIAALLVSIACGVIGTYVVIKRIVFISGGIAHAAFGGVGLGFLLGVNPILAAVPFSLLSAVSIGFISRRVRLSEDTAIGILWTVGMALGIIFINLSPGYTPDISSYLFGNILTVPTYELVIMASIDLIIVLTAFTLRREFLAISFDEDYASVIGMPTGALYLVLLCLIALSVVVLIKVVGIVLVLALLTIPPVICRRFTFSIGRLMLLSCIASTAITLLGLGLSYVLDLASGATIVLTLAAVFVVSSLFRGK